MWSIRKINPMVRAVGTMGAVAALVGGVTFANLNSNVVALSPNDLTTSTASLAIDAAGACTGSTKTVQQGLHDTSFAPGDTTSVTFCLSNTGGVPLTITASIPQSLAGSAAAQNTSFSVVCNGLGAALVGQLSNWGPAAFSNNLPAGTAEDCTASATLQSSYTGSGNETIPSFQVNFSGTEPTPIVPET